MAKQVLVACETGIVTSTIVMDAIEEMAKANGLNVNLVQIKLADAEDYAETAALLVTTAMTEKDYPFPVINARAFFTGIGIEETEQQILDELNK